MKRQLFLFLSICFAITLAAQQTIINGPVGSGSFGNVTILANGNFVVVDPLYNEGATADVGAVYLYNGFTYALISTLKGSTTGDLSGSSIISLNSGNFLVLSPQWDNAGVVDAGALTWCNGTTGTNGVISSANSLVGSKAGDFSGSSVFTVSGNYVLRSPFWDNGSVANAGAVTWGNGTTGISGVIGIVNSLVGTTANDNVGNIFPTILSNGNYVLRSTNWDNGGVVNAGAVTWCNGTTGRTGAIGIANSLVGTSADDFAGNSIFILGSNYILLSPLWDNVAATNAGAVTWCNGSTGRIGVISSSNSLVGNSTNDEVGANGIKILSNGNYLVASSRWDNSLLTDAGAVTWANGSTGITGIVSSTNSLVGSNANDLVGSNIVALLNNGNYLVVAVNWDNNSATNAGAVTWGNGASGTSGVVSVANSLVGSTTGDNVGTTITVLNNGNYVVASSTWNNGGIAGVGAVTWGNGSTGITGLVSSANSLVGSTINDNIGAIIKALNNGNYVVASSTWNNGGIADVGAVTWCDGTTGRSGIITSANSLVGTTANDQVGKIITALSNGNYVAQTSSWDNAGVADAGAVTWCNGTTVTAGPVTIANSLVGSSLNDRVGTALSLNNGNYVVISSNWNNGAVSDAGAVTWGNGNSGTSGIVSSSNSLVGSSAFDLIGNGGILFLANGNYVVKTLGWNNGSVLDAGAITWCNGTTGTSGVVSSSNSLVGSSAFDAVGADGIIDFGNSNYLVLTSIWNNGGIADAGAVTFCNGTTGTSGVVSSANSLVGSTANDQVGGGFNTVNGLPNGNYIVRSPNWDNGTISDAGAATWCNGTTGTTGPITSANSLVGSTANDQVGDGIFFTGNEGDYLLISLNWDNGAVADAGAVTWGSGSTGVSGTINSCNSVTGSVAGGITPSTNGFLYFIAALTAENKVVVYNPTGQALANHLDVVNTFINGNNTTAALVTNPSCRIIGTLTPNGANPVNGSVTAKSWIESSVPSFGGQPFVARHYEITPVTSPGTATGRVTLYFTQQEFTDFNNDPGSLLNLPTGSADAAGKANLRIEKRSGTSSNGTGLPGSYSGTNTTIDPADGDIVWNATLNRWEVSFDVTGFSGFFVKTTLTVLPLTLLEFNGRLQNGNALLNWKTENELNTDQFLVERSTDGRNFTMVALVDARNQPGVNQYNYIDAGVNTLAASMIYYRLKQTDIDSRFTYSRIIALSLDRQKNLMLYPNPATDQLMVTLSSERAEKVQIRIVDNAGRILRQQQWNSAAGSVTMQIEVSNLAKGMYYLEVKGETTDQRKIFVKL